MVKRPPDSAVMEPDYMQRLEVYDAQQDAIKTNRAARDMYLTYISPNWISKNLQNRNLGLAIEPPPSPPLMTVVADESGKDGHPVITHAPFPDLQIPVLPPNVDTGTHGRIAADPDTLPADRIDKMQKVLDRQTAMLLVLNGKLDQLLGK